MSAFERADAVVMAALYFRSDTGNRERMDFIAKHTPDDDVLGAPSIEAALARASTVCTRLRKEDKPAWSWELTRAALGAVSAARGASVAPTAALGRGRVRAALMRVMGVCWAWCEEIERAEGGA